MLVFFIMNVLTVGLASASLFMKFPIKQIKKAKYKKHDAAVLADDVNRSPSAILAVMRGKFRSNPSSLK